MENNDYCGPFWAPSRLRRVLSGKFNASCKIHDLDYESKKFSRKVADKRFLDHMLRQSEKSIVWRIVAYFYYISVRIGGRISWKK